MPAQVMPVEICGAAAPPRPGSASRVVLDRRTTGIANDLARTVEPDHATRLVVGPRVYRLIVEVKVEVAEQERLDFRIAGPVLHRRTDSRQVIFVDHLISLNVETPGATRCLCRHHGLV